MFAGTHTPTGPIDRSTLENSNIILAYRHTDGGVLRGSSESLIPIEKLPWTELPGFELLEVVEKEDVKIKLWNQLMTLHTDQVTRIHFAKTIVYLRNFGAIDNILWSEEKLEFGPSKLHGEKIDHDLTIAPPEGSGLQVRAGQEVSDT